MIIAFDPGEKNTGIAMFEYNKEEKKANLKVMAILNPTNLADTLHLVHELGKAHTFVVENFRIREEDGRHDKFRWSELLTIRRIGAIEQVAHMTESKVVFQEPRILNMARRWCDLPLPKGHIPDDKAAYIHGAFYMMQNHMIETVKQITKFGQEELS